MPARGSIQGVAEARGAHGLVAELLVRCGRGDEAALAALVDLFQPVAGALALTRAPDRPVTDVVLDAFNRIWRRAGTYEPGTQSAVAWVLAELAAESPGG